MGANSSTEDVRQPLVNEARRSETLNRAVRSIEEACPSYCIKVQTDVSGTRAVVILYKGSLVLLWFAFVFGALFAGCVVQGCYPYYRWVIYIDTTQNGCVDYIFGVKDNNSFRRLAACIFVPIACICCVNGEYTRVRDLVHDAMVAEGLTIEDESPDTYREYMKSEKLNDKKFLEQGVSESMRNVEVAV